MADYLVSIKRPINNFFSGNRFYFVLFCGVVLSFLFILIARLAGVFADSVSTFAVPGSFFFIILFLLPGYLTARLLILKNIVDKKYLLLLSIAFSSVIAYIAFWAYFLNNVAGRIVSGLIILSCVIIILFRVLFRFENFKDEVLDKDFIMPLTLVFLVGCMYLGILFLHDVEYYAYAANNRFVPYLPVDNVLPFFFLERIFYAEPLTDFAGDWLASDRPPLFSAMLIIVLPFGYFMDMRMFYQFVGTFMQCLWIPALYSLCKFFSFDKKIRNFIIASAVFSGIFVINSTFLWPKLLATVFFTLLFLMVFELSDKNKITKNSMIVSIILGISAALAFLSHGSIAFSFLALGLALIITEKRMNYLKHAVGAIVSFFVVYFPWTLFQQFVDPPGNRLTKEHLAGVIGVTDYSLLEALYIGYSERSIELLFNKTISNFFAMFADFPDSFLSLRSIRDMVFSRTFGTALFLNIFLIVLALYFIKKFCFEQRLMSYRNKIMFFFTIFSFSLWPLLMMTFNQTIIHQGSYFNILLLFILIAFGAKHSNVHLRNLLFVLNILLFVVLWVINIDANIFTVLFGISLRMLVIMVVSAVLFFAYLYRDKDLGVRVLVRTR